MTYSSTGSASRTPALCGAASEKPAAALSVTGLCKSFSPATSPLASTLLPFLRPRPSRVVLDDFSMEILPGEVVGISGPNGSGKSTLLRLIAGLLLPDRGTIVIGGIDTRRSPREARRQCCYLSSDERSLNHRLSLQHNLEFFASLHGLLPGRPARRRAAQVLEELDLTPYAHLPYGRASSGLKQRALVARALLGRPWLLLADEPTRSIDEESRKIIGRILKDNHVKTTGGALVIVEHHRALLENIADRVLDLPLQSHPNDGKRTSRGGLPDAG